MKNARDSPSFLDWAIKKYIKICGILFQKKCGHHAASRYDKYESKQVYWVESELEAEWEKTTSRPRRETAEFEVETDAQNALLQAVNPLSLDVKSLAQEGIRDSNI